jgi:hypothetical protein
LEGKVKEGGIKMVLDSERENILKLFKSGVTIKGLTNMIYSQRKAVEKEKRSSERVKVTLNDIKSMVEQTIYEYQMGRVKL